jgi:hypothetical protein
VQEIKVDAVGREALEAVFAGAAQRSAASVLRIDLADNEDLIAQAAQSFAKQALSTAVAIHFGGVDQCEAEFDPGAQRRDFASARRGILSHPPCALPEPGRTSAVRKARG